jgi:hypothetical protein
MREYLLPFRMKPIGMALVILGLTGLGFYLWTDFRLILPVFAIYSSFLQTDIFKIVHTNITDELIIAVLLAGFILMVFSEEKTELRRYRLFRYRAWIKSVLINSAILLFSVIFVYGTGFIVILAVNLYSTFLIYLVIFHFLKIREKRK